MPDLRLTPGPSDSSKLIGGGRSRDCWLYAQSVSTDSILRGQEIGFADPGPPPPSPDALVDISDISAIDLYLLAYKSVTDEALGLIMGGPAYSIICDEACILWSAVLNCPIIAYIKDGSLYVTYNRQYGEGNWTVPAVNGSYTRIVGDGSLWSGNSFLAGFRDGAWYCLRLVEGDTKFREVAMITDDFDDTVSVTYHATRDSTARQMFYVNDGSDTTVFFSLTEGETWQQEA